MVSPPADLFSGMNKLIVLEMEDLLMKDVPENIFDELTNINTLSLSLKSVDTSKLTSRLFEKISFLATLYVFCYFVFA
jgi:hypothetical protein